jgi:phosphoglucosamine mutase
MGRLFGTDGVRGVAGSELTAGLAMGLAAAATDVLAGTGAFARAQDARRRPVAVVGRDPRASGEFLEAAVVAGLAASGVDVHRLGVIPTPAVAYLTAALDADFGVMLSASHNPAPDNGIKIFARGGVKLPDAVEDQIEARLAEAASETVAATGQPAPGPGRLGGPSGVPEGGFGRVRDASAEGQRYLDYLLSTVTGPGHAEAGPLAGLRVVVDCAHGAASMFAPGLLRRAGAEVIEIGTAPDGLNINEGCGSTHLDQLAAAVVEHRADAGIAHDGDADRCLAVDATGQIIDGDQILAVLALALRDEGRLAGDTVVATVMSNLGFRLAMRQAGISVVETPVGDRYLIAAMLDGKFVLGGEQSGHVIYLRDHVTGDGLAAGLLLCAALHGRSLSDAAGVLERYVQCKENVRVASKALTRPVREAVERVNAGLGDEGRVLVRPSGTEPIIRVLVEARDGVLAQEACGTIASLVESELG